MKNTTALSTRGDDPVATLIVGVVLIGGFWLVNSLAWWFAIPQAAEVLGKTVAPAFCNTSEYVSGLITLLCARPA